MSYTKTDNTYISNSTMTDSAGVLSLSMDGTGSPRMMASIGDGSNLNSVTVSAKVDSYSLESDEWCGFGLIIKDTSGNHLFLGIHSRGSSTLYAYALGKTWDANTSSGWHSNYATPTYYSAPFWVKFEFDLATETYTIYTSNDGATWSTDESGTWATLDTDNIADIGLGLHVLYGIESDDSFEVQFSDIQFDYLTYNVTYDGNSNDGGSVPTDSNDYEESDTVTVLGNTGSLTKSGYTFGGWNTAANGSGTSYDPSDTFSMPGANVTLYAEWDTVGPSLTTNAATEVNSRSAILQGTLDGLGGEASADVYFEYGTTTSYGSTTDVLTMTATGNFCARPTDLDEETTYHFRAVADYGSPPPAGSDAELTTLADPFELTAEAAVTSIYWDWLPIVPAGGEGGGSETVTEYLLFNDTASNQGVLDTGETGLVPVKYTFSVMCWVKIDVNNIGGAAPYFLYETSDRDNKNFWLGVESDGRVTFTRTPGYFSTGYYIAETAAGAFPTDNKFHKLVVIKTPTAITFYIDDVEYPNVGDAVYNGDGHGNPSNVKIGCFRVDPMTVAMAGLKIWSRELTGSDITAGMTDAMGADALLWYKMDEGSGATVTDYSGNGYDGSLSDDYDWVGF